MRPPGGVFGGDECSDPLAAGSGAKRPLTKNQKKIRHTKAKTRAVKLIESDEGKRFVESLARLAKEAIHKKASLGFGSSKVDPNAARAQAVDSVKKSKEKDLSGSGDYGETQGKDISIDAEAHTQSKHMAGTLVHEAAHVVVSVVSGLSQSGTGLSGKEEHKILLKALQENPDFLQKLQDQSSEGAKQIVRDLKNSIKSGKNLPKDPNGDSGGGQPCGAVQEAMANAMRCTTCPSGGRCADGKGPLKGKRGGVNPAHQFIRSSAGNRYVPVTDDGTTDPSIDQFTAQQGNVFSQCLAQAGVIIAGVDGAGKLVAKVAGKSSTGCAAMLCNSGSTQVNLGGNCACSGQDSVITRDLAQESLCFTSDACFKPIREFAPIDKQVFINPNLKVLDPSLINKTLIDQKIINGAIINPQINQPVLKDGQPDLGKPVPKE